MFCTFSYLLVMGFLPLAAKASKEKLDDDFDDDDEDRDFDEEEGVSLTSEIKMRTQQFDDDFNDYDENHEYDEDVDEGSLIGDREELYDNYNE